MTAEKKTAGKKGLPGRITRGLLSILVPLQEQSGSYDQPSI